MPLFVCDKCHGIDNTALSGNYWTRLVDSAKLILCAECYTGTWHGRFEKQIFDTSKDDPEQFCYVPIALAQAARKNRKKMKVITLPDGSPMRCAPTGRVMKVIEIADGGLFEIDGQIWEKLPGSCGNLSDFNDASEVLPYVKVNEYRQIK